MDPVLVMNHFASAGNDRRRSHSLGNDAYHSFSSYRAKMSKVECGDKAAIPLSTGDHCGVGQTKGKVRIFHNKLQDSRPIPRPTIEPKRPFDDVLDEQSQTSTTEIALDEIADL